MNSKWLHYRIHDSQFTFSVKFFSQIHQLIKQQLREIFTTTLLTSAFMTVDKWKKYPTAIVWKSTKNSGFRKFSHQFIQLVKLNNFKLFFHPQKIRFFLNTSFIKKQEKITRKIARKMENPPEWMLNERPEWTFNVEYFLANAKSERRRCLK